MKRVGCNVHSAIFPCHKLPVKPYFRIHRYKRLPAGDFKGFVLRRKYLVIYLNHNPIFIIKLKKIAYVFWAFVLLAITAHYALSIDTASLNTSKVEPELISAL